MVFDTAGVDAVHQPPQAFLNKLSERAPINPPNDPVRAEQASF